MASPICESCQGKEHCRNQLSFYTCLCVCTHSDVSSSYIYKSLKLVHQPLQWQAQVAGVVLLIVSEVNTGSGSLPFHMFPVTVVTWWKHRAALNFPPDRGQKTSSALDSSRLGRTSPALWLTSPGSLTLRSSRLRCLLICVPMLEHTEVCGVCWPSQ